MVSETGKGGKDAAKKPGRPQIKISDIKIPEIKLPEIKIPELTLLELRAIKMEWIMAPLLISLPLLVSYLFISRGIEVGNSGMIAVGSIIFICNAITDSMMIRRLLK
ncbi:MAG: hypothetical protein PHH26_07630 [Candidatus Thermoplasmatota archaeon]|nr:hypothetical protein [Candidatus Thermoplasmatota archaeon]